MTFKNLINDFNYLIKIIMAKNDIIIQETLNDILNRLSTLESAVASLQNQINQKSSVYKNSEFQKTLTLTESSGALTITTSN